MNVSYKVLGVANAASLDAEDDQFSQFLQKFLAATLPELTQHACEPFPVVTIGSVCTFIKGNTEFNKDFCGEAGLPFLHYSQIQTKEVNTITATPVSYIDPQHCANIKKLATAQKGDVIVTGSSIGMPGVGLPMVWNGEQNLVTSQDCIHIKVDKNKIDSFYLAYYLKSYSFFEQKRRIAYGSGIFHIYSKDIAKCTIPLPPLEVQQAIGNFLFQLEEVFANKTFGITKEIELRKFQFEYFLDIFTAFDQSLFLQDNCAQKFAQIYANFIKAVLPNHGFHAYQPFPIVKIGDYCTFNKGNTEFNKDCCGDSGLPFLHYSQIQTKEVNTITSTPASYIDPQHCANIKKLATAQKGDIIVTDASIGMPGVCLPMVWNGDQELITSQHCIHIRTNINKIEPLYLAYYFKSQSFFEQKRRIAYGSAIFCIYAKDIAKCTIPLPPLEVQQAIANFLFNLEQLAMDATQGLAREQQLRQTQLQAMIDQLYF